MKKDKREHPCFKSHHEVKSSISSPVYTVVKDISGSYLHPGISVSSLRGGTVSNVLAYFLAACL